MHLLTCAPVNKHIKWTVTRVVGGLVVSRVSDGKSIRESAWHAIVHFLVRAFKVLCQKSMRTRSQGKHQEVKVSSA